MIERIAELLNEVIYITGQEIKEVIDGKDQGRNFGRDSQIGT